jgi:hypothetical protein
MEDSQILAVQDTLQEFWSLLYDAAHSRDALARNVSLLRAWGVFHYAVCGPTNCELCQTPVRLAIPITSERGNGESPRYACLCTNCTFQELERTQRIVLQVGPSHVEYSREGIPSPGIALARSASAR